MGMYVSTKEKDNKTVMKHKKHDSLKQNITRIPEFWIGDKSENSNRTEQKNNKTIFPNEECQDEWGT